jgi:hypothetical protein
MPLLAYFGVVGAVLLGLLFVAEAQLGPPAQQLSISTNFYGLPPPYKANSTPILTVRDAPSPAMSAPTMPATALAQHTPAPSAAPQPAMSGEAPLKIRVTKAPAKPKKTAKQAKPPRNLFASSGSPSHAHRVW